MDVSARRRVLLALAAAPFAAGAASAPGPLSAAFAALERDLQGELGVALVDGAGRRLAGYREDRRFPMCSTFKAVLAAAILARADTAPGLLEQGLALPRDRFVSYSPVTQKHAGGAMSVAELCAAAVQASDNTAANTLLRELGGPAALTRFARGLGDPAFRLDRWETALNSAVPGDPRDTTTPLAMARTLRKLLLGGGLTPPRQAQLRDWLLGNTTGGERIRAGVPAGWHVGDKTGSGAYGTGHDVAVLYPPDRAPLVLVIYTRRSVKDADARSDIVAGAARIALRAL
jgi:beta-lactamase class A